MKKKKLSLTILSILLCAGPLAGASISYTTNAPIKSDAATHQENFSSYKYSGSYYNSINLPSLTEGMQGTLRKELSTLTKPASTYAYSAGMSEHLPKADEDPTNSSNMIYFYTRDSVKKNPASTWNREHVWPKSLSNGCWGTSNAGSDMLHLRPTYDKTNSSRGNLKYGDQNKVNPKYYNDMLYGYSGSYFEPIDSVKGDAARDIMYVWVAWYNYYGSNLPSILNVFQSFDVLMKWHILDKPDVLEGNRNDYVQSTKQKNRNPFVDHPEYAWKIFGEKCSSAVLNLAKETYPAEIVKATGVNISETNITLQEGQSKKLTATVLPETATNKNVTWSSSNIDVAKVSTSGEVTGLKEGASTITVKTEDGGFSKTCKVTVNAGVRVIGVSFTSKNISICPSENKILTYTILPNNASNKNVSFISSDPNAVKVDNNGQIIGINEGASTITITTEDGGFTDTCIVTCENGVIHVTGVSLANTSLNIKVGEERYLIPSVVPTNADDKSVSWSSDNPDVLSISSGFVKGLKEGVGKAIVTTNDGGFTAECTVTVIDENKPATSIEITSKISQLVIGSEYQFSAKLLPEKCLKTNIIWSSSDENILSITSEGKAVALNKGIVTITVKTQDEKLSDSCEISIVSKGGHSEPTSKGCSSSLIASSLITLISCFIGIACLSIKKRKDY